jgi:hypothetical protein
MTVDLILSEVTYKHVVVCGMQVPRPPSVSPSQWLAFWEKKMRGQGADEYLLEIRATRKG